MENKELAEKIISDFKSAPAKLEGVKSEVQKLIQSIIIDNAAEIVKIDGEEKFYDFLTLIIDSIIVLPQPWESVDSVVIKMILKKFVDPLLDKYAGKTWFEKMKQFIAEYQVNHL